MSADHFFSIITSAYNAGGRRRSCIRLVEDQSLGSYEHVFIDALTDLKRWGICVTVLATGNTCDHRFPEHFRDLMERFRTSGVEECFRVLGIVPYGDLLSLMRHSLAVINPSLCEGWSTTVEEAKALDKAVLLSDIAVHREQNPAKGIFFDPRNANELAERMKTHSEAHEPFAGKSNGMAYASFYKDGRLAFARGYQSIVKELCNAGQQMSN